MRALRSAFTLPSLPYDADFGSTRRPRLTLGVELDDMVALVLMCRVDVIRLVFCWDAGSILLQFMSV